MTLTSAFTLQRRWIAAILLLAALTAAAVAALSPGGFGQGWLAAFVLLGLGFPGLWLAWRKAGAGRLLGWMTALAFFIRLACGVGLSLALPVWSYDNPVARAGHIFDDAYKRDQQAWQLAQSDAPLWNSFTQEFTSDQYGGLLAVSAGVYRTLSPDVQRPFLIVILVALVNALGLPFFWAAVRPRWGQITAGVGVGILAFYPESILLGSFAMREPLLIGLGCILFWAAFNLATRRRSVLLVGLGAVLLLALISSRAAVAIVGVCAVCAWIESGTQLRLGRLRIPGWWVLGAVALLLVVLGYGWLQSSAQWEILSSERSSGWLTILVSEMGERWKLPFFTVYGLLQPVLPAALVDPAPLVNQAISVLRAAGWYALLPALLYAFCAVWREEPRRSRQLLVWLILAAVVWLVVSSIRAGGDQWDNPRYRTIFLPWLALLAGWAWQRARTLPSPWLWRWMGVVGIFVALFTLWYLNRYFIGWKVPISFWTLVLGIMVLSGGVMLGGWLLDRRRHKRQMS